MKNLKKIFIIIFVFFTNISLVIAAPIRQEVLKSITRSTDITTLPEDVKLEITRIETIIQNTQTTYNQKISDNTFIINGTNGTLSNYKNEYIKANNICGNVITQIKEIEKLSGVSALSSVVGVQSGILGVGTGVLKNSEEKIAEEKNIPTKSNLMANMRSVSLAVNAATSIASTISSGISISKSENLIKTMKDCNNEMIPFSNIYNIFDLSLDDLETTLHDLKVEINNIYDEIENISNQTAKDYLFEKGNVLIELSEKTSKDISNFENNTKNAKDIILNCKGFDYKNIETIQNIAIASTVTSGVGSAVSIAGTTTSIMANSKEIKDDNTKEGIKKEKQLNLASNILSGVATGTSAASATLGIINIKKVEKDIRKAMDCKYVLSQN